jgi:hypothetical protein
MQRPFFHYLYLASLPTLGFSNEGNLTIREGNTVALTIEVSGLLTKEISAM